MEQNIDTNITPLTNPLDKLNPRQRKFVEAYCGCGVAGRSARLAGYAEGSADVQGHKMLRNAKVLAAISYLGRMYGLPEDEGILHLTAIARSSLAPFLKVEKIGNAEIVSIDMASAEAQACWHLLKKVKQGPHGLELELDDRQAAINKLLKIHGTYKQLEGDANQPKMLQAYKLPDGTRILF